MRVKGLTWRLLGWPALSEQELAELIETARTGGELASIGRQLRRERRVRECAVSVGGLALIAAAMGAGVGLFVSMDRLGDWQCAAVGMGIGAVYLAVWLVAGWRARLRRQREARRELRRLMVFGCPGQTIIVAAAAEPQPLAHSRMASLVREIEEMERQ